MPKHMNTENTNEDRAESANIGLAAYAAATRPRMDFASPDTDDKREVAQDFLTDLMHYCDKHGLSFEDLSSSACSCYHEEKEEEDSE